MWNFKGTLWNSTQNILPIHWKIWLLYNIEILRALRFKSSYAFLKRPPASLQILKRRKTFYILFRGFELSISLELPLTLTTFSKFWNGKHGVLMMRHGPRARYVKLRVAHASGMSGTFSPPPRVRDPNMHHGTCVFDRCLYCCPGLWQPISWLRDYMISYAKTNLLVVSILNTFVLLKDDCKHGILLLSTVVFFVHNNGWDLQMKYTSAKIMGTKTNQLSHPRRSFVHTLMVFTNILITLRPKQSYHICFSWTKCVAFWMKIHTLIISCVFIRQYVNIVDRKSLTSNRHRAIT